MFTGLVESTGRITERSRRGPGFRLTIRSELAGLCTGESVNVNGACLTVVALPRGGLELDVSAETATVTTLGRLPIGTPVNLERALRVGDRLGGHLVSGHVDAAVQALSAEVVGEAQRLVVGLPSELGGFVASKGSVALDGVSLTVNEVSRDSFSVMLIPETLARTTLAAVESGRELNLEVDLLARYAVRWLETAEAAPARGDERLRRALERSGWM